MSEIQAQLLQLTAREREEFLKNHADSILENEQFFVRLEGEDLADIREQHTNSAIALSHLEEEFDRIKTEYKGKMKVVKAEMGVQMQTLKQNGEWKRGTLFGCADHTLGIMQFFDQEGNLVNSRRLLPSERQITIFNKAASN